MSGFVSKLKSIWQRNSPQSSRRGKVIAKFAESLDMVYFGAVDQHKDEHKMIRGLTASAQHTDEHYCAGNYQDHEVTLVYRTDSIGGSSQSWMIAEISLPQGVNLPHIFMGDHNQDTSPYRKLFLTKASMIKVPLEQLGSYSQEFTSRYSIFTQSENFILVNQIITPQVAQSIAAHFWPLAVEVEANSLFVYSTQEISPQLLEVMIKNGVWLADQIG